MRWSDLDQLGHVNNVLYADYLQEARVDLLRLRVDDPVHGLVVVGHHLEYDAPVLFDGTPVMVETWATEIRAASFALAYEIYRETAGERTVFVRASSLLAPFVLDTGRPRRITEAERATLAPYLEPAPAPLAEFTTWPGHGASYPLRVRFSDLDPYGHVNNVRHLEFFQEARVAALAPLRREGFPRVVARQADVGYRRPIELRHEPYEVRTWLTRLGTTSITLEAEILDGDEQLARARHVMVCWDPATGRPVALPADARAALTGLFS